MPFIVIFNIVICVLLAINMLVIVYVNFAAGHITNKTKVITEKKEKELDSILKVRKYAYLVMLLIMLLMIIVNIIF